MKQKTTFDLMAVLPVTCLSVVAMTISSNAIAADLTKAITGGTAKVDVRYRYETVDQDGIFALDNNAIASTIRTRLGYETGVFNGLTAFVEMENIADAGADDYAPENPGYPVIADPTLTELNQSWVQWAGMTSEWTGLPTTKVKVGRQRLILDNARFVGNVGWRQNEQTFDAVSVTNDSIDKLSLSYAFLDKRHTITGTKGEMDSHLLNAKYAGLPIGAITVYSYLLDFDVGAGTDTQTYGLRFDGNADLTSRVKGLYTAEYATQSDYQDSTNIDTEYALAEGGLAYKGITAKVGYELLAAADGGIAAFSTPLATLHVFNGWADKFLVTPATGLEDIYVSLGGALMTVNLSAVYHEFSADEGSVDFGTETDVQALKKFGKTYALGTKYAAFNTDSSPTYRDTDKFWIWGELTF